MKLLGKQKEVLVILCILILTIPAILAAEPKGKLVIGVPRRLVILGSMRGQ